MSGPHSGSDLMQQDGGDYSGDVSYRLTTKRSSQPSPILQLAAAAAAAADPLDEPPSMPMHPSRRNSADAGAAGSGRPVVLPKKYQDAVMTLELPKAPGVAVSRRQSVPGQQPSGPPNAVRIKVSAHAAAT